MSIIEYIIYYIQPLLGLLIGLLIFAFIAYMNWYGNLKEKSVKWIAHKIYRDCFRSEQLADGLFMTITAFLLMFSGIWIILALLYLTA